jgi:hypothetical protein
VIGIERDERRDAEETGEFEEVGKMKLDVRLRRCCTGCTGLKIVRALARTILYYTQYHLRAS